MRIGFLLLSLLLLTTFAPPRLHRLPDLPDQPIVSFTPVSIRPERGIGERAGGLVFLGGWTIESNDYRFGGISALHVGESEILAASDAGILFRFTRPDIGIRPAIRIIPLSDGPGSPRRKSDRDSEAMVAANGHIWIAFERTNAVWRYSRDTLGKESAAAPRAMRKWRANSGSEAMLRLPDGRFMIFSEGAGDEANSDRKTSDVLLFDGDPSDPDTPVRKLLYSPPHGYRITDAAILSDGRILFLNRRFALFEGMSAKLGIMKPAELMPGTILRGNEVADLRPPMAVDNMEALSVARENGRTIVWIASDDNFSPLQRTLLLKFMLAG
ncbi:esterase-like activity of phytase family protein [Sphingosinicella rhizophila]|uniref:Esterase-like activity of phytase family protein n=1 Tax=Sphingosinicella rhizophila TaxID=3050082 RepID=A0ABU3Q9S1_9SPHN|nr:esterase-like activity of phytase family protein [Sphingosinicella sp. GR2756]MDT9599743.1 esterase-like activity of phytase family protein [Sphingosinicella sp. GR2756]